MARAAVVLAMGEQFEEKTFVTLENMVWLRPVAIGDDAVDVHVELDVGKDGRIGFEITSEENDSSVVHFQGAAILAAERELPVLDLETARTEHEQTHLPGASIYEGQGRETFLHGPSFRAVQDIFLGDDCVLAKLALPASVSGTLDQFTAHPSLLDAGVQAALLFSSGVFGTSMVIV